MAGYGVRVQVRHNRLPQIMAKLPGQVEEINESAGAVAVKVARSRVAVLTGQLQKSIHVEGSGKSLKVISNKDYAAIAEFGGLNRPARPYMRPGALAAQIHIKQELSRLAGRLER